MKKTMVLIGLATSLATVHGARAQGSAPRFEEQAYRFSDCEGKAAIARLPFFDETGNAGRNVNAYLHMVFLEAAPPARASGTALPLPASSPFSGGLDRLDASVRSAFQGRLLTVTFNYSHCGVGPGESKAEYAFAPASGRIVSETDLFTAAGRKQIGDMLATTRRKAVSDELKNLRRRVAQAKRQSDKEDAERARRVYEQCLADRFGGNATQSATGSLGMESFDEHGAVFVATGCATQADRAFDELGDFRNRIDVLALKRHMSDYGRYVFFGEGSGAIPAGTATAQFFRGKIGDAAITLFLGAAYSKPDRHGAIRFDVGSYYYDRYRTLMPLTVALQDGAGYVIAERDADEPAKGVMTVRVQGATLSGTWRGGGKSLALESVRQ